MSDSRAEQWAALARQGLTLAQIGQRVGVSRERVRQVFAAAGLSVRALRDVRCANCGTQLRRAHGTTSSGLHYCTAPACVNAQHLARQRAKSPTVLRGRARCAVCGRELPVPVRADGLPQFCGRGHGTSACWAAAMRDYYARRPEYRAATRERTRRRRAKAKEQRNG